MLYLLVKPDSLLAGLPLLRAFGEKSVIEADPDQSWTVSRGEHWSSLENFADLLPKRLDWLRSADLTPTWYEDTHALEFRLKSRDQFLAIEITNWMQLVLPEQVRPECLLIGIRFENTVAKYQSWLPIDHPVMPLLVSFLVATKPVYGIVRDDDVSYPSEDSLQNDTQCRALEDWQNLWREEEVRGLTRMNCGYVGAVLASTVRQEQSASSIEQELGHLVEIEGGGFWFTRPGFISSWREWDEDEVLRQHYAASERLSDVLATIPDSAIFPNLTP